MLARQSRAATSDEAPLWSLGFRPFFLLAAGFSGFAMLVWLAALFLGLRPGGPAGTMHWHAHEMIYGFAVALLSGFLLTAASNWTSRVTATGRTLAGLAGLWLVGRLAVLAEAALPQDLVAALDLAYLPALTLAIGRPIWESRSRRNYGFVALLTLLWGSDLLAHYPALAPRSGFGRIGMLAAIDVIVVIIALVTGRIVPMFTRNTTKQSSIGTYPWLDRLALVLAIAVFVLDVMGPAVNTPTLPWWLPAITAIVLVVRSWRWGLASSRKHPMLWILHLGYLWVPLGFAMRAVSLAHPTVSEVAATHCFTAGAMGSLGLGMMTRVALGHTGRPIIASRAMTVAFVLVLLAAIIRVAMPIALVSAYRPALIVAGALWSAAFAIYVYEFVPVLTTPRVDHLPK